MPRKPAPHASWLPAPYELADADALRAVASGTADEHQQRRAMKWIIERACRTYEPEFQPEGDRETYHASGRRFVGLQIVKLVNMPRDVLAAMRKQQS